MGPLVALKRETTLKAFSSLDLLSSPTLRALIPRGELKEVGSLEQLDVERVLALKPQVLLVSSYSKKAKTTLAPLEETGVKVIEVLDYLEGHPLGRTQWLYLYGLLYDDLAGAEALFAEIEKKYLKLKNQLASNNPRPPTIYWGFPLRGFGTPPGLIVTLPL